MELRNLYTLSQKNQKASEQVIKDEKDLDHFLKKKEYGVTYIMEEFITGDLISFDGVCNSKGEVVICDQSHFPTPVDIVFNERLDEY